MKRKGDGGRETGEKSGGTGGGLLRIRRRAGGGGPTSGRKEKDGSIFRNRATPHGSDHRDSLVRFVGLAGHSKMCSGECGDDAHSDAERTAVASKIPI